MEGLAGPHCESCKRHSFGIIFSNSMRVDFPDSLLLAPRNMISKATAKEQITADEIEDVLYLARANEAEELTSFLSELAQKYNVEQGEIIAACVDQETGNTAIHYSAANGHTGEAYRVPGPFPTF